MKKILLLLSVLSAGVCANAIDWQPLYTNYPNVNLYVDVDSVKQINNDEYYYAVKYTINDNPEQTAYLKSNTKNNYIGIIRTDDLENYNPGAVFTNPHVFMKPLSDKSFLNAAHQYIASNTANTRTFAQNNEYDAVYSYDNSPELRNVNVSNNMSPDMHAYVVKTCKILEANWNPPASTNNTRAIVVTTIGKDGSLINYRFVENSGDEVTDHSIISALAKTVPYPKFPTNVDSAYALDFQFVFEHDVVRKSVVY